MNKAITEGLVLTPPKFEAGLNVWSLEDGRPGTDTYANAGNAAIVPADQDFASCLELIKADSLQRIRFMGATPIFPGCYYRITARVKAVSGNLPRVRAAATPVRANGSVVSGVVTAGSETTLTAYGRVVTVTAILGTGGRGGVDMAWGSDVAFAHLGLEFLGPNGGVVRVDDIEVEDITGAFLRDMMDWVDVRDFGAKGDGVTDDTAAFAAADNAAAGRSVLVSKGVFRLDDHVTMESPTRFEGRVTMPASKRLSLTKNFELNSYIDAFGDEEEGFRRAIQALFNFTDHDTLDMMGRRIELSQPLDVQAAVFDKDTYANQRSIQNGQIDVQDTAAFNTERVTAAASFTADNPRRLTNVQNIGTIKVGSLVRGPQGVGREIYVLSKNNSAGWIELSNPLWGAPGRQTYTFDRFKYALDFSGFAQLQRFSLENVELLLSGKASGILLPPAGVIFHVKDCFFSGPKDRGLTSHGLGCQGLLIDRCQFLSNEQQANVEDRVSIGFNVNANDVKIRNNRAVRFRHFAVLGGSGHIITGNHFFQGDSPSIGQRTAGIIFADPQAKTVFVGNYVDNAYLEWTNEYDPEPDFSAELSFGGLQIVGNIIFSSNVASSYAPLHIKPYGSGHFINGMTVSGNNFKTIRGQALNRVDFVDTTHADLDYSRFVDVNFNSNTFHAVNNRCENPTLVAVTENTPSATWDADLTNTLPFRGHARIVTSVMPEGPLRRGNNTVVWAAPYAQGRIGGDSQSIRLTWPEAVKGKVFVTARCDTPG
ncbi:glycosyl hydrolase family 28-related protein [Jannaschia pohangensis]|uniref:Pectate lyase superfamily protein n=1 Tax=Jannaschia pohangensis TaxID=390807 RepID=A0A1I3QUT0_9RHOB|nr:glycosyl hydrolase family 28-related protein [Jannaschia pohangensis]SFJ38013.1 Pectate lyase superfamily protein [Jannaschia pohangensis]